MEQATPATIAAIRGEVASCLAAAAKISQQAQVAEAGNSQGLQNMTLAAASQAAHATATSFEDDFYGKKKFDPYLKFASAEDEQKYRQDEAKRKEEIDKALALNTPEGTAHALKLEQEQLDDAGAHGATASPDFKSSMNRLQESRAQLSKAITESKPAPKADKAAEAAVDPLDAIKPSLEGSKDVIAALKAAGVTIAAQGSGHGVSASASRSEGAQRSPT